jgi:hypothetical protein
MFKVMCRVSLKSGLELGLVHRVGIECVRTGVMFSIWILHQYMY